MRSDGLKKNISYSLASNILSFVIVALVTLIIPKFIGVRSYGLFQLYTFYCTYIGFLHFGWADGLYLRYGGEYYESLDKRRMSGQFWAMTAFELFISIAIGVAGVNAVSDSQKSTIVVLTAITIALVLPRTMLQLLLQCTNRIREYSLTLVTERSVYLILVIVCVLTGQNDFPAYILSDITGKLLALVLACCYCKDIVICIPEDARNIAVEAYKNISVGIKLMLSNIAALLITGVVRYSIELKWDVETFGKISLTLAVSNMLMVMINAVSLVMYPALKRTDDSMYAELYGYLRTALDVPMLGLMILYYPAMLILSAWLPDYKESLIYMALLFPVCIFESKNSMLLVTFFKTLRKEKLLMSINIATVLISVILTYINVFRLGNLDLTVLSIVVLVAVRATISEIMIGRILGLSVAKGLTEELLMASCFIVSSWCIGGLPGLLIYLAFYIAYVFINKKQISEALSFVTGRMQ